MFYSKLILIQKSEKNGTMHDPGCHSNIKTKNDALAHTTSLNSLGHCHTSHRSGPEASEMEKIQKKSCYCRLTCLNHLNHDKYHDKTLTPAMCNKGTSERPGVQQNTKKTPPKKSIKDKMSTFMDYHLYTFSEVFFHIGLLRYTKT